MRTQRTYFILINYTPLSTRKMSDYKRHSLNPCFSRLFIAYLADYHIVSMFTFSDDFETVMLFLFVWCAFEWLFAHGVGCLSFCISYRSETSRYLKVFERDKFKNCVHFGWKLKVTINSLILMDFHHAQLKNNWLQSYEIWNDL